MAVVAMMPSASDSTASSGEPGCPCQAPHPVADVSGELFEPRQHGCSPDWSQRAILAPNGRLQHDFGTNDLLRVRFSRGASEASAPQCTPQRAVVAASE